jgi:hypothetical protein
MRRFVTQTNANTVLLNPPFALLMPPVVQPVLTELLADKVGTKTNVLYVTQGNTMIKRAY